MLAHIPCHTYLVQPHSRSQGRILKYNQDLKHSGDSSRNMLVLNILRIVKILETYSNFPGGKVEEGISPIDGLSEEKR